QSSSLYGNLVVTRISSQINFFENGVPLFTTENTQQNEEVVHYAMAQRSSPKRVLLVSGGVSGVLNEILKYGVGMVDYVELDPLLLDLGRRYSPNSGIESTLVHSYSIDGRMFIKEKAAGGVGYDVVILNVPDPGNLQTSRFYSIESFREIKKILGDDGVLSLSMSSSENYLNPETKKLNSCIYNTLGEVFKNVVVIPGGRNYFIASDGNLTYNIVGAIEERGVNTSYVNRYYLSGMLTDERVKYTLDSLTGEKDVKVNQDFRPASYYYYLQYWTDHFRINLSHVILLLLVLFLALLIKLRPITLSMFTVGFAGASLEIVLIMAFQVLYGYAYYKIGAIVTAFMFGLFIGAVYATKKLAGLQKADLSKIVSCVALYSIILPSALHGLSSLSGWMSSISNQLFFPLATVVLGFMVGLLFPLANKMQKPESTQEAMGLLYSLDLFGAFFGSLLTSIFLIPVYGIINVSLAVGLINLAVWLRLQVAGKND
ncbi:MAG: hypothetical protein V1703_02915, partial [Candidatus Altiarchaeota archaeon]